MKQTIKQIYQFCFRPLKQSKGLALIMVLSGTVLVVSIIQETIFNTQTEYRSTVSEFHSLKAYYAAKAGMEISLLRIKNYRTITKKYGSTLKSFQSYIDLIWKIPFNWPPVLMDENEGQSSAEEISKLSGNSLMQDIKYNTVITATASRIDLNDLASPIPSLRKWTFKILFQLIQQLQLNEENQNPDEINPDEILDEAQITDILSNIADWIDPNSLAGQSSLPETGASDDNPAPPNRSFISLTELHQVPGMNDTLYEKIKPFVTIHGEKGLNINTASIELLQALGLPLEVAEEVFAQTSSHLLFTQQTFANFLNSRGLQHLDQELLQDKENSSYLNFNAPHNFQVESIGISQNSIKIITALYFDSAFVSKHFDELLNADIKRQQRNPEREQKSQPRPTNETTTSPQSPTESNQAPTIIYWKESS